MPRSRVVAILVLLAAVAALWLARSRPGGETTQPRPDRREQGSSLTPRLSAEGAEGGAGALEGVVLDPGNAPVPGARINLTASAEPGRPRVGLVAPLAGARSDAEGRFRFERLADGFYDVGAIASSRGLGPAWASAVAVRERRVTSVRLRLAKGGLVLRGRVLDSNRGAVPAARVYAQPVGMGLGGTPPGLAEAELDGAPDGGYRLLLPAGDYMLIAMASGYAPSSEFLRLSSDTTKNLRLDPEARLAGTVTEAKTGQPAAGAEVWAAPVDSVGLGQARRTTTDASGGYTLGGLHGGTYLIRARLGRLAGERREKVAVADARTGVDIAIEAGLVVSGRVTRADGGPVADATVTCTAGSSMLKSNGAITTARSSVGGDFAVEGLFPGEYQLMVRAAGYAPGWRNVRLLEDDSRDIQVVLQPSITLTGRVVDGTDGPVPGARVTAVVERGKGMAWTGLYRMAISDEQGAFTVADLDVGRVSARAEQEWVGAATYGPETLAPGTQKMIILKLSMASTISGTVRGKDGRPAPGATVLARAGAATPWVMYEALTDGQGRYAVSGLSAGTLFVSAARPAGVPAQFQAGRRMQERQVQLAAAERMDGVDIVLPDGGKALAGQVVTPDGRPAVGAMVMAAPGPRPARPVPDRVTSDGDGHFSFEDLDDVPYTVWAEHPDHASAELRGVVPGIQLVVLRLGASASISGAVAGDGGKPVTDFELSVGPDPDARVPAAASGKKAVRATTVPAQLVHDAKGRFSVSGLGAGAYRLSVRTPRGAMGTATLMLREGEQKTDVVIEVRPAAVIRGRVVDDETGRPLPDVTVSLFAGEVAGSEGTTDGAGAFVLDGAPPGSNIRIQFRSAAPDRLGDRETVEVPGRATEVEFGVIRLLRGSWSGRPSSAGVALGLEHVRRDGTVLISGVRSGSPAERAGVQPGDHWRAIDRKPVQELGHDGRLYLLSRNDGRPLQLTVESANGGQRQVVLAASVTPVPN
jgi:protocatechuate 3,4-dioxygenase beta subunit